MVAARGDGARGGVGVDCRSGCAEYVASIGVAVERGDGANGNAVDYLDCGAARSERLRICDPCFEPFPRFEIYAG